MESRVGPGHSSRTPSAGPRRGRALILSLAIGGVVALGAYAGLGRLDVGPDEQVVRVSSGSVARQAAQLDELEENLDAALAKTPPKLPPIPKYPPVRKPHVPKPKVVTLVSYVPDVTYEREKDKKGKKYKHDKEKKKHDKEKEKEKKKREQEKKKKREEKKREEKKKREEQKKHDEEKKKP